mgnify:FL=1
MIDSARILQEVTAGTAVLLDVRTKEELQSEGRAHGAVHFDLGRLMQGEVPSYPKSTKLYLYCKGGSRAAMAKGLLEAQGFSDVAVIGGLADWEAAGGEVAR